MSGFRVGTLLTHNAELFQALDTLSYYKSVSEHTQFALTNLLQDKNWTSWYLNENQRRLETTFRALEKALHSVGVKVFPSKGGLFAWADFSAFLMPGQSEKDLWTELYEEAGVLFTTGQSCFGEKPGMFRIIYTWPEGGPIAMKALEKRLVKWKRKRDSKA